MPFLWNCKSTGQKKMTCANVEVQKMSIAHAIRRGKNVCSGRDSNPQCISAIGSLPDVYANSTTRRDAEVDSLDMESVI